MEFGERLAKARRAKKLTQTALGVGLGTDGKNAEKSVVYGWEKRGHFPRADQVALICRRLGISADYLVLDVEPVWPFSPEMQQAVKGLDQTGIQKLEGVMRAHLGLPSLSEHVSEGFYNAVVNQEQKRKRVRKNP